MGGLHANATFIITITAFARNALTIALYILPMLVPTFTSSL
jgi:hypothetical protein